MKLTLTNIVTYVGVSILLIYAVFGLMKFYGISTEDYSIYIIFYVFIFFSVLILVNSPS